MLVSGASTGIGRDAAAELARRGFAVLAGVRSDADARAVSAAGVAGLSPVILDVTVPAQVAAAVRAAEARGPLWAVVNNAGVSADLPVELLSDGEGGVPAFSRTLDINVIGAARVTAQALPALRRNGGRVVNVGSVAGKLAAPGQAAYAASKHALEALSDSLRRELLVAGHTNVSVSVVDPACVRSAIFGKSVGDGDPSTRLPPAAHALYAPLFEKRRRELTLCERTAEAAAATTTPAIVDAVGGDRPLTRYYPAGYDGTPAWVLVWLAWALPDRVLDVVLTFDGERWLRGWGWSAAPAAAA